MRREKKDQILAVLPEKIRGILLNHGLDFERSGFGKNSRLQ